MELHNENQKQQLELNEEGIQHLKETRQWSNFLAILGFVFMGVLFLGLLIFYTAMKEIQTDTQSISLGLAIFFLSIICIVYFFPVYFLSRFSWYSKRAIREYDSSKLTQAMKYLKLTFRFIGIYTIAMLTIYTLAFFVFFLTRSFVS